MNKKIELDFDRYIQLIILASTTEILLKLNLNNKMTIPKGGLIKVITNTKKEIDLQYNIMPKKYL